MASLACSYRLREKGKTGIVFKFLKVLGGPCNIFCKDHHSILIERLNSWTYFSALRLFCRTLTQMLCDAVSGRKEIPEEPKNRGSEWEIIFSSVFFYKNLLCVSILTFYYFLILIHFYCVWIGVDIYRPQQRYGSQRTTYGIQFSLS